MAIMLAGNIPQYGALTPGGLMNWASMLGMNAEKTAVNAGTLAGSMVLILFFLIWSVALFERQEIE